MKKSLSILLVFMLLFACLVPGVYAAGDASDKRVVEFGKAFNGVSITSITEGVYGRTSVEPSWKILFSGTSNRKVNDVYIPKDNYFTVAGGGSIKISTKFALDGFTSEYDHVTMGMILSGGPDSRTRFNPYLGKIARVDTAVSTPPTYSDTYNEIRTPLKTWVTYDFVYDMVDSGGTIYVDKYSLYVDGQEVFKDCKFAINGKSVAVTSGTNSKVFGISYAERGRQKDVHMADMSVTYYPPSCTEDPITPNPWEASGLKDYFTVNKADYTLILANPSLTNQQIADSAPDGWTFSRVSYNDAADGKLEYIKMVNNSTGASYYKRFVSQDYAPIINVNFTGATTDNANAVWGDANGMRYVGVATKGVNGLESEVKKINPKSADNDYIKLSYTSLPDKLCGLGLATKPSGTYPYINGELSGRFAYEWSFMVDEFATNAIACRLYFNGTVGTDAMVNDSYKTWIPFQVTNGVLRFDEKGTVTPVGKSQTVLPGEWHHFVIITDTNNDTVDIYQNGVLIGTRQFTSDDEYLLNTVNGMEIGINNSGLPTVNVPHSVNLDDFRIGYVSEQWTPETASVTSSAEGINVNNDTSVIFGDLTSATDVTLSEGATAVLSDCTLKVTDASGLVVRYYKVCENEFSLVGFDISDLTTAVGEKSKTVTIENNMAEPYSAVLILAAYSQDGALVSVDVSPSATVYTKQTKQLTASVTITADEPVAKFKAFLWKNTDSAYPLFENLGK